MGSCIRLNCGGSLQTTGAPTIIVSGAARSGTSMVAAALDAAGLWRGDHLDGASFEDVDLACAAERPMALYQRLGRMLTASKDWRSAIRGFDLGALGTAVARRNAAHERWGFKRPNVLQRLGREGLALFREPRVILCLRDPVALAQRSIIADGVTLEEALRNARRQVDGAMRIAKTIDCPTLLVSFEKAKADRDSFLAELFGFCGLDVEASSFSSIHAMVESAGEKYNRIASASTVGFLDKPLGWSLSGWCAAPGRTDPSEIDVFANGVKLISVFANRYRPDLLITGCRSAYRGFQIDLRELGLQGSEIIDVVLSGSGVPLHDSGYQLATI